MVFIRNIRGVGRGKTSHESGGGGGGNKAKQKLRWKVSPLVFDAGGVSLSK